MKKAVILLVALLMVSSVQAGTSLSELIQSIRDMGIYFDQTRYPDSLLKRVGNDIQTAIATKERCIEKADTLATMEDTMAFDLPADYYLINTVLLGPIPNQGLDEKNRWRALKYVPSELWNKDYTASSGRPTSFTRWGRTLEVDLASPTGDDTLIVRYWALPNPMDTAGDTLDLPAEWGMVVKEYMKIYCRDRIYVTSDAKPSVADDQNRLSELLLGRPADEK